MGCPFERRSPKLFLVRRKDGAELRDDGGDDCRPQKARGEEVVATASTVVLVAAADVACLVEFLE